MSVADHFDHTPDAGFVRRYDSSSARRQFQISLVLMILLAATAFLAGALIRFDDGAGAPGLLTSPASAATPAPVPVKPAQKHKRSIDNDFAGVLLPYQG